MRNLVLNFQEFNIRYCTIIERVKFRLTLHSTEKIQELKKKTVHNKRIK